MNRNSNILLEISLMIHLITFTYRNFIKIFKFFLRVFPNFIINFVAIVLYTPCKSLPNHWETWNWELFDVSRKLTEWKLLFLKSKYVSSKHTLINTYSRLSEINQKRKSNVKRLCFVAMSRFVDDSHLSSGWLLRESSIEPSLRSCVSCLWRWISVVFCVAITLCE